MNLFEKHYNSYRIMMVIVGLWPFDKSIFGVVQRTVISLIIICTLALQAVVLLKFRMSVEQYIVTGSLTAIVLLFFARYVSFVLNFPAERIWFTLVRTEQSLLNDPNEVEILAESYKSSSRVIYLFFCACSMVLVFAVSLIGTPIMLDLIIPLNESRPRYLRYLLTDGFFEQTLYIDVLCLLFIFIVAIGLLCLVCTESTLSIVAHYLRGLFLITRYRIRNAISNATKPSCLSNQVDANYTDFYRAVEIHRRAIRCIGIGSFEWAISYLILYFLAVVSFSISLYRLFYAVSKIIDAKEMFVSAVLVFVHILFTFVDNYSGQIVINESLGVFDESYNSMWYCMPVDAQKILLFIMLRSVSQCSFTFSGLFVPCFSGFSSMMSASFSYFTVMYSSQ